MRKDRTHNGRQIKSSFMCILSSSFTGHVFVLLIQKNLCFQARRVRLLKMHIKDLNWRRLCMQSIKKAEPF